MCQISLLKDLQRWYITSYNINSFEVVVNIPAIKVTLEVSASNSVADVAILVEAAAVVIFSVKTKKSLLITLCNLNFSSHAIEMITQFNLCSKMAVSISGEECTKHERLKKDLVRRNVIKYSNLYDVVVTQTGNYRNGRRNCFQLRRRSLYSCRSNWSRKILYKTKVSLSITFRNHSFFSSMVVEMIVQFSL